jgi:O-antigen ligase
MAGALLALSLAAAITVLEVVEAQPALVLPLAVAVPLACLLLVRPRWSLAVFAALVWASIGRGVLGGLPSPVEVGGLLLLGVATWFALAELRLAGIVALACALVALPVLAAGLLAPAGPSVDLGALQDLALVFVASFCARSVSDVDRVTVALACLGIVLGLGAAWSVLVGPTALFPLNEVEGGVEATARAAGPFGESNFFALSLAALVPIALYQLARGGRRRALGVASLACLLAGLLATGSRGGVVAALFALAAYATVVPGRGLRRAAVATVVAALALLPLFAAQAADSQGRDVGRRATENRIALAMFAEHPVTGVGPRRYEENYRDYARRIGNDPRANREPHSLPLEIAAEQGLAGLLGWVAAALLVARLVAREAWRTELGRAVIVAMGAFAVGGLFLHGSQLELLYLLAGLAVALAAAPSRAAAAARSGGAA